MRIRSLLILFTVLVLRNPSCAQPPEVSHFDIMESLAESVEGDVLARPDYESVMEDLEYLHANPLDLNTASEADLQKLPFLTDFQIMSFLRYREEEGNLFTLYELQLVHGFDDMTIAKMMPYAVLQPSGNTSWQGKNKGWKSLHGEITFNSQRTLEKSSGYIPSSDSVPAVYPGNPWRYYVKAALRSGNMLSGGIVMEKDPGEPFFKGSNRQGFDFYSAHLMVQETGPFKTIIAGDYRLQFGQGLTLSNGYSPGKSSLPLNVIRRYQAVRPYTSVEENNFFRGLAFSCVLGKFTITGFYSSKKRDVNVTDTLESGGLSFSSFLNSGFHRTADETNDEDAVRETAFGSNLTFRTQVVKIGASWVRYGFDGYLEQSVKLYKSYDFYGNSLDNAGVDYTVTLNRVQLAGEASFGHSGFATMHSAVFQAGKYASLAVVYRDYPASFTSLYSSAFSEGAGNSNEKGVYIGTELHPAAHWNISAYADFYRFPWLRYRVDAPSTGSDYLVSLGYSPNSNLEMTLRLKYEQDQVNSSSDSLASDDLVFDNYLGIRAHLSYRFNESLLFRTRLEFVNVSGKEEGRAEKGFMCYQDIEWRPVKAPFVLYFRYAWFDTENYGTRIYAYEQQTLPSFAGVAMYDEGFRTFLMLRYDFSEWLSGWLRMARTSYTDRTAIGSGHDEISSGSKHEVRFQCSVRF